MCLTVMSCYDTRFLMPIPPFSLHGVLPSGRHVCTVAEVKARFGQADPLMKRVLLWQSCEQYINWIRPMGCFDRIWVDGSFVTDKPDPGDVDISVLLPKTTTSKFEITALHPGHVKQQYGLHLLPISEHNGTLFFEYVGVKEAAKRHMKPQDLKGILEVVL